MHHTAVELCSSATSYTIQRRLLQTPRFKTWVQSLSQLVLGCCVGVLNICCGCTEHLLWVYSAFVVGVLSIFCGCTEHFLWVYWAFVVGGFRDNVNVSGHWVKLWVYFQALCTLVVVLFGDEWTCLNSYHAWRKLSGLYVHWANRGQQSILRLKKSHDSVSMYTCCNKYSPR